MNENKMLKDEIGKTLNWIQDQFDPQRCLTYFYQLSEAYFAIDKNNREKYVPIVGTAFPEEFLLSCGLIPWWMPGGSSALSQCTESLLPRDADSISRSLYGYLMEVPETLPVIVPVTGDDPRKICYLLRDGGREVYPLELQGYDSSLLPEIMADRLNDIMASVSPRWCLPGKKFRLKRTSEIVHSTREAFRKLLHQDALPGAVRLFLANTYYYTDDLQEWARQIAAISNSQVFPLREQRPRVLLAGSPILFPNYKVLRLIHGAGLEIAGSCDSVNSRFYFQDDAHGISGIAAQICRHDCSGSQADACVLKELVTAQLDNSGIRGIVVHIIKGQIEYDFAMNALEKLFAQRNLPVFRIETDYHENDIEQLAIRLDAFSELLR